MANPVTDSLLSYQPDASGADTNLPISSTAMGTGQPGELAGEIRRLKSELRSLSLAMSWERWKGCKATISSSATAFAYQSATQFAVNDNWTATGTRHVAIVGRRVKATLASGDVYGKITDAVFTTATLVTVQWDSAQIDNTLSEVQLGIEVNASPAGSGGGGPFAISDVTGLQDALNALLEIDGTDSMTGDLHIYKSVPTVYLEDSAGTEWAITATGGHINIYKNVGSHASPDWSVFYRLSPSGNPQINIDLANKLYVDQVAAGGTPLANGVAYSTVDFTLAPSAETDITGMSVLLSTHGGKVRTSFCGTGASTSGCVVTLRQYVDAVQVESLRITIAAGSFANLGFDRVTAVAPAGGQTHIFKITAQVSGNEMTITGATDGFQFAAQEMQGS